MSKPHNKLKLQGFNNLTKTLSFNLYAICYTGNATQKRAYGAYIDEAYNATQLSRILSDLADIIDATVLHIARQDYEPQGASVTMMIAEEPMTVGQHALLPESVVAHLDKSHLTVHTYPESHPESGVSTLRMDVDVSTCGLVSPLKAINYLVNSFEPDILTLDYRVRGFTRDVQGRKHFIDHDISSIQDYLSLDITKRYQMVDMNLCQENIFHTRMMVEAFQLDDYLFGADQEELSTRERARIHKLLRREMVEIFNGVH